MDPGALIPVAAVATGFGVVWEQEATRRRAKRHQQATCDHRWGRVVPVNLGLPRPSAWVQFCETCGKQRHCDEGGGGR